MISAKRKATSGLAAVDNYVFRDTEGNPRSPKDQEGLQSLFVETMLRHPEYVTYEIIENEPALVLLLSEKEYEEAFEGIENKGDLYKLNDGTKVMLRCKR
jgi:hypothetical protein